MPSELARWKKFADTRLTPIEEIKTAIREIRESLDAEYPSWKAAYDANPADYPSHDARREYFVTLLTILQNAQLGFLYIREHLTNRGWWAEHTGEYHEGAALQALREHAVMIKFFSFHATASATEETLRAIVRGDPSVFGVDAAAAFYSIYQRVLKLTCCKRQYEDLFEAMRLTRNTIHTNRVHRPPNHKDRIIDYGGRTFTFEVGKTLEWMGDDFPEWLAREIAPAMECVVRSPVVSRITKCPRGQ